MKKAYLYSIGAFIVIAGAVAVLTSGTKSSDPASSPSPTAPSASMASITKVEPADVEGLMAREKDLVILDVRTPEEYSSGHLENAQNIDYKAADVNERIGELDRTKPYLAYCRTGVRSAEFTKIMQQNGFGNIYDLSGGITAWSSAGLPITH